MSKGNCGSDSPLEAANPFFWGTAYLVPGQVPCARACFFRGRHPSGLGSSETTMLSMEPSGAPGDRPGRHGGGLSDGGRASLSNSSEEGGGNP